MMMVQVENQILLLMFINGVHCCWWCLVHVENQILLFIMFMSSVHRCWWWCLVQVENQILLFIMFMSRAYRCDNGWCRWRNWLAGLVDVDDDVWGRWSSWSAAFIDVDDVWGRCRRWPHTARPDQAAVAERRAIPSPLPLRLQHIWDPGAQQQWGQHRWPTGAHWEAER